MKNSTDRIYLVIDLKSFFASVECVDRGLDPFTTNLVVADPTRTEKTICLAITPAMKALGIKNRCRVFEIPKDVDYIMAPPRMSRYLEVSADVYSVYLKYISKEDMHVYSIDEVFIDVTDYLVMYQMDVKSLGKMIIEDVYKTTGIRSTCGMGTNMYLAKIALDITAKHAEDFMGYLDEELFKETLWHHTPITDFWMTGPGTAKRLAAFGMKDMYDVAHCNEELLYKVFGIDAEILIDHAWGREYVTIEDIKRYVPKSTSISSGQVLSKSTYYEECKLLVKEMADLMCLDLVGRGMVTQSITLSLAYSRELSVKPAHGSIRLNSPTSSSKTILGYITKLYEDIMDKRYGVRKISISFNNLMDESYIQYDLFTLPEEADKEHKLQEAVISLKNKYGKNAVLKGMNLLEGGTTIERNNQIGGHRKG